ncbi:uncharacterized protein [Haliotis asinina]|uniref:uncharacterized protein n=1 Tax=Haliotis asinina TaxID=109174 RepID=UPI0035322D5C
MTTENSGVDMEEYYDKMFSNRYTEEDTDFQTEISKPVAPPPCVMNWYTKNRRNDWGRQGRGDNQGRGGYNQSRGNWGHHGDRYGNRGRGYGNRDGNYGRNRDSYGGRGGGGYHRGGGGHYGNGGGGYHQDQGHYQRNRYGERSYR